MSIYTNFLFLVRIRLQNNLLLFLFYWVLGGWNIKVRRKQHLVEGSARGKLFLTGKHMLHIQVKHWVRYTLFASSTWTNHFLESLVAYADQTRMSVFDDVRCNVKLILFPPCAVFISCLFYNPFKIWDLSNKLNWFTFLLALLNLG